jgi:hypothetical protein
MQKTLDKLFAQMGTGGKHEHDALLVLTDKVTGRQRRIWGRNLVTTAGNVWYAQKACGQSPTNDFDSLYLATACAEGGGNPIVTSDYGDFTVQAGSEKHVTATYPMTPDTDTDNTGDGTTVVSWKFEYAAGDGPFATAITHSFIAKTGASGTDPILNGYKWASSWTKDASTSAKVFANHTILGS